MFAMVWIFLAGLGTGGIIVWTLASFTTVSSSHSRRQKDCRTVQSIAARIERERREVRAAGYKVSPLRCG